MANERIQLRDQEKWYERLKRLEEAGVRTIPANNGFDIIDPFQSETRPKYEIRTSYQK